MTKAVVITRNYVSASSDMKDIEIIAHQPQFSIVLQTLGVFQGAPLYSTVLVTRDSLLTSTRF